MELLTSQFRVFCDTYDTELKAVMHEAKGKKKIQLTITGKDSKNEVSLWKEDVILLSEFLNSMADNLDSRLT